MGFVVDGVFDVIFLFLFLFLVVVDLFGVFCIFEMGIVRVLDSMSVLRVVFIRRCVSIV